MSALYKSIEQLRLKVLCDLDKAHAALNGELYGTDAYAIARITVEAEMSKLDSIEKGIGTVMREAGLEEIFTQYSNGLYTLREAVALIVEKVVELNS